MLLEHHKAGVSWRTTLSNLFSRQASVELMTRHTSAVAAYDLAYSEYFGGQKWPGGLSASGRGMLLDHTVLRRNARTAVHETPQARAIVGRFTDHIVDTGIILNPQPMAAVLGITEERARDWGDEVARRFHLWAMDKKVTRSETENFYQSQRMAAFAQQRDNDYFVRLSYSGSRNLQNPLQLQFIDADQINGYGWTSTYGVQLQDDGIVRDSAGRETAYKIQIRQPDGSFKQATVPAVGPRSGRRFMLHGFQAEYPGQGRGFPRFSHAVQEFENLTDFTSAQIKKAINQSNLVMFVKPSKENVASNPMENLVNTYAGPATEAYGADPTPPSGESALPLSELVKYVPLPEATDSIPGSVGSFNLQQGEDLKPFESSAPAEQYDRFVDAFTAHLAASVGMPIEVLLMRFNQNYSASRATLVLFWRIAQIWRSELDADFNNPIYENWLAGEIAARRVDAAGWTDPVMRAAWLNAQWEGAPMPEIDPLRQSKANKNHAEIGAKDLDTIARSVNGSDGRVNRAKLQKQYDELPPAPWAQKQGGE
jgi:lambda family phage portal protein